MRPYSFTNAYGEMLTVAVPDELKVVIYHLHSIGKKMKKALPVISVALLINEEGVVVGRGISICSPHDYHCFNKKEGRLRAVARALRAHNKSRSGQFFINPNATKTIGDIFGLGMYDEFNWAIAGNVPSLITRKYEHLPRVTTGEQELIESRGF